MAKRTDIIDQLIEELQTATESTGTRGLRFLHEVNDFPSFYVYAREETRTHISNDVRYASMSIDVRGYLHTDDLTDTERFVRKLEVGVQLFADNPLVEESRTLSVRTDEGLMYPYSICDLTLQIIYLV